MPSHASRKPATSVGYDAFRLEPYVQTLLTYVRRPAFCSLVLALAASFGLVTLIDHLDRIYWFHPSSWFFRIRNNVVWVLFVMLAELAPFALCVVLASMLVAQTRVHLLNWRSRTFPGYGLPHVVAATLVLASMSVAASAAFCFHSTVISNRGMFPQTLVLVMTLVTFLGWIGIRWSPALGPVLIIVLLLLSIEPHAQHCAVWCLARLSNFRQFRELRASVTGPSACYLLAGADIVLMPWLFRVPADHGKITLPIRAGMTPAPRVPALEPQRPSEAWPVPTHPRVEGTVSRAWHRRRAVLPPRAAAWVAAVLFALLVIGPLSSVRDREPNFMLRALLLATLTPGIIAAAIWRERWPVLGFESLFPGRRRDFIRETAFSMAMNLAEMWLAGAAAAIVAVALFHPPELSSTAFGSACAASALSQVLVGGVLFFLTPFRAIVPYVVIVTLVLLAIATPFELAWPDGRPQLSAEGLLAIAAAEAAVGIILMAGGRRIWTARELT